MTTQGAAPATAQVLTQQQLQWILNGACILGSGGGGPYSIGQQVLAQIGNSPVSLMPLSDVQPGQWAAVSAFVGSPDAAANQQINFSVATTAWYALEGVTGNQFGFVLPGEIGAGNSLIPMVVAAQAGIPIADAAGACRAIPGLMMSSYAAKNLPVSPMYLTDGTAAVTINCANNIADPTVRGVISSGSFQQDAGVAFWSMTGQQAQSAAIPGMTTLAMNVGQTLAQALGSGNDPVAAVQSALPQPNYLLCTGKIVSANETTSGGFDFGTVVVQADSGATITIYNQNENLIAFSNKFVLPLAMGPDLICYMTKDGQPFSNADIDDSIKSKEIAVIGVPAYSMRNTFVLGQFAQALSGIGYAGPYIPIEIIDDLNAKTKL